jgi:pimeloyl-ACP methyl ester carboxylesterase
MQVVVDSLLTHYERSGTGKALLVLHGWGDNSASWQAFANVFDTSFDVITVDLPGFGGTQMPPETWGLSDYAAFVGAFLQKLRVQPYAIIGHSNGGAIAIRGLANKSITTDKLVLIDSAGIRSEYLGRKKAIRLITKTGKVLTKPLPPSVRKRLRRKVYDAVGSDMLVVEKLQETFKRVVTDDVQQNAATLKLPTLLLYGEDDLSTPVQYGRMFHHLIAGSQFVVISGAGHFAHLDKPAVVNKHIKEFL